jgi:hypothetical protein
MRNFKDFSTKAEAEAFKQSLSNEAKARITVRRSWIGLKSNRKIVVTFAVNYYTA